MEVKYKPIVYLHSLEKYKPVSLEYYIQNSDLYENDIQQHPALKEPAIFSSLGPNYSLKPNEDAKKGDMKSAPIYARMVKKTMMNLQFNIGFFMDITEILAVVIHLYVVVSIMVMWNILQFM